MNRSMGLRIGTAPDSWGVWFPDDPRQIPASRFLDEAAEAGYVWIELGPFGYLPTDAAELADALAARGLKLSGGTMFAGLHAGFGQWERTWSQALPVAALASKLGARHLVVIPDLWRSDASRRLVGPRTLDAEQWAQLAAGHDRLGKALLEEFGMKQVFHSHADSHVGTRREVQRLLEATDERYTSLCLDTGHYAYYGGDSLELIRAYPSRIGYLHLKQVDPNLLFDVLKNDVPFAAAVRQGVMIEPPNGTPMFGPIIEAAAAIDPQMFAIVEQDLYPVEPDVPLPIAVRTRRHILESTRFARID